MLEVRHLCKSYGTKEVLQDISFTIPSGTICGLVGKNGAGKTTFFHSLLRFVSYEGGIILVQQAVTPSWFQ